MKRLPRVRRLGILVTIPGALSVLPPVPALGQATDLEALRAETDTRTRDITDKVVAWRRDLHQHPELGNREFRTAGVIAEHLRSLGMEVNTEVAHTGVVGILRGGRPGPVVALRADMDALPVTERTDLPFASRAIAEYMGREVGVMHACGHDNHMAILMGTAEVLAGLKERLPGTVKFIFQPSEEGPPPGERGGARLMMEEGVRSNIIPDSVVMVGTVRTLDLEMRDEVEKRIRAVVAGIAESAGAEAEVFLSPGGAITYNDPDLTRRMVGTLERVGGPEMVVEVPASTGGEDFSVYQLEVPGLFFFLGVIPDSIPLGEAPRNHSPYFFADEAALPVGVRALSNLAVDFLAQGVENSGRDAPRSSDRIPADPTILLLFS